MVFCYICFTEQSKKELENTVHDMESILAQKVRHMCFVLQDTLM